MVKRYFIYLAYNGENFCGWQVQPNGFSVQEAIEQALATLLRKPITITGAGRTDAGVHARKMVAHFDFDEEFDCANLTKKLNRILSRDVVVYELVQVKPDAHARFNARARLYTYHVTTAKDVFNGKYKHYIYGTLDMNAMNRCAKVLFEYEDFTSFSKLHTDVKTNNCTIMHALWQQQGNEYVFTIKADRFLRNMVRSIVGTLLDAGKGKIDADDLRRIIEAKDRCCAGVSVPAHALFLEEVEYGDEIFEK